MPNTASVSKKNGAKGKAKTADDRRPIEFPLTREEFLSSEVPSVVRVRVSVGQGERKTIRAKKKIFSTGSCGFHSPGRFIMETNSGKKVVYQANIIFTAIGSKPAGKSKR